MKKTRIGAMIALLTLGTAGVSQAAFTVGGENGWQLSTDGIVDVFATYNTSTKAPSNLTHTPSLLGNTPDTYERFGVGVGLLPSVVAFNIKAPTTNGVESTVRIGLYPSIQNQNSNRFNTGGNIDFREMFYTAKGAYGELLAGRALNLFQGKNILTDMTLLTAGTVGARGNTVTLGHIGYGYLYAGFGPQLRYTTPDFGGAKFAIEVAEPYKISAETGKTNSPRIEAELSYARTFGGTAIQGWLSGLYQTAPRADTAIARPGKDNESIGGAYGLGAKIDKVNLLFSGYGGRGLGVLSAQDGEGALTGVGGYTHTVNGASADTATDSAGNSRLHWGFLAQATYKLTDSIMLGANYGQTRLEETSQDVNDRNAGLYTQIKKQESGVATVTYNLNKFTQFVAEYIYAQSTWHDGATQHSNQFALGTMFYW